jgi:hypothetical protein
MVIEWLGFAAERGRHIQATETGWPCSTGFTNSFRRELVADRRGGGGLMASYRTFG